MAPKPRADMLPRVSKYETVMCIRGKIHILHKLRSDMLQCCWP